MSAMDYIDRFVAKLLIGAQVTCVAMAIINYFDWSLPPALVGLGAVLVAVVLFGMQVVLWLVRRFGGPQVRWAACRRGCIPGRVR
jgi:hypothetical protein